MTDVNCPYCGAGINIEHDGSGYEENIKHEYQCEKCKKNFVYTTSISFYYEAEKADCLNDGNHDWQITSTFPRCFAKMECSMCEESRELTEEERIQNNIETKQEYFHSIKKATL